MNLSDELQLYFAAMFCSCMVCHGELARLKPRPRHLTEFYLWISAGGAAGGLFVGIVAPLIFSSYFEWQIGVAASGILSVGLLFLDAMCRQSSRNVCRRKRNGLSEPPSAQGEGKSGVSSVQLTKSETDPRSPSPGYPILGGPVGALLVLGGSGRSISYLERWIVLAISSAWSSS